MAGRQREITPDQGSAASVQVRSVLFDLSHDLTNGGKGIIPAIIDKPLMIAKKTGFESEIALRV